MGESPWSYEWNFTAYDLNDVKHKPDVARRMERWKPSSNMKIPTCREHAELVVENEQEAVTFEGVEGWEP